LTGTERYPYCLAWKHHREWGIVSVLSFTRARAAGVLAGTGAVSLILGGVALVGLPSASADQPTSAGKHAGNPPGNNGTIKIEGVGLPDKTPENNPHQGCTFVVEFYNYDKGDLNATVTFEDKNPTKNAGHKVVSGNLGPIFIGEDAADGGNDLDAKETYTLSFSGEPHPKQGYHLKITVHADGSKGNDTKHKVFWVKGCEQTPPTTQPPTTEPTATEPTTTEPTTEPTTTEPTTTEPTTTEPTTTEPTTTEPPTTEPPTTEPTTTEPPTTEPPTTEPTAPATESPTASVPTAVNAGMNGPSSGAGTGGSGSGVLGGTLLAAGALLLASGGFMALRRRSQHAL
jgi:hypothetical protein